MSGFEEFVTETLERLNRLEGHVDPAFIHGRWHAALEDVTREPPGPIRDHIEQHDADVARAAVAPVLQLCEEWDALSKGPTLTTARIRAAINGRSTT